MFVDDGDCPSGPDGFYHPGSENQLIALVKQADREGRQLRVRGAAHSPAHALYTDPSPGFPNRVDQQQPPRTADMNVMLDRYRAWRVVDETRRLVEVDAGMHLGPDPSDRTGTATLETSLLWQLWRARGWSLSDTGGITHQTVSGFTGTGSAGGSIVHSLNENLRAFRIIDGRGDVHEISVDTDPDRFYAHNPHLGLLGVVSKIVFQCVDTFDISGLESITRPEDCAVDLFGLGDGTRVSLSQFLRQTEFARVEWWPQRGAERVLLWQAASLRPSPGFVPIPYEEFTGHPGLAEFGETVAFAIVANLSDLPRTRQVLRPVYRQLSESLAAQGRKWLGSAGGWLGESLGGLIGRLTDLAIAGLVPWQGLLRRYQRQIFAKLLSTFIPLDSNTSTGTPQRFQDWAWHGLPMDNQASDVMLPLAFMEMWFPISSAEKVTAVLRDYFAGGEGGDSAFERTGINAWELYGAAPSRFWLSPSYTTGRDEWTEGAFRVDSYWYQGSPDDPTKTFYPQFWELFKRLEIPFRLHWGKHRPPARPGEWEWVDFFRAQYPRWTDFLDLRQERDPNNIFLTRYWRNALGLWDAPSPVAGG